MKFFFPGFVDVAVAIATGPAVAQGQSPIKVKLSNRLDRKRLAIVLEEDEKQEGHEDDSNGEGEVVPGSEHLAVEVDSGPKHHSNLSSSLSTPNPTIRSIPTTTVGTMPTSLINNIPTNHGSGSLSSNTPFCSASQSVSVTRGNPNTEAMTAVMASYGAMMGQMAKGMLEGVGPQLMNMLQNFQVEFKLKSPCSLQYW